MTCKLRGLAGGKMKLSVIIPVFNERNTVVEIIRRVQDVPVEKEIIVVDDGSTDGTREILREFIPLHPHLLTGVENVKKEPGDVKVILKDRNEGKGAAIREGLQHVTGDVVVIQDGDLEYEPMDWLRMLQVMKDKDAQVVYGSRVLGKGKKSSFAFYFGGRFLSVLTNILFSAAITDEPTCYKMFRADVIKSVNLECMGFEFCPEVTAKVLKKGFRIHEVPISYRPRNIKEGKKIRWKDGLTAIRTLFKYRF